MTTSDTREVAVGVPVEQVQIALFAFAGICVGLAVWLVVKGCGKK